MKQTYKIFFSLSLLEGVIAFIYLFRIQSMERNTLFLNYSAPRLLLGGLMLVFLALLLWISIKSLFDNRWLESLCDLTDYHLITNRYLYPLTIIFIFGLLFGIGCLVLLPLFYSVNLLRAFLERAISVPIWLSVVSAQSLIFLFVNYLDCYQREGYFLGLMKKSGNLIIFRNPTIWVLFTLILLCGIILLPAAPTTDIKIPGHDSGIFLYFGSQILNGQIPYRDLWDHKPPLVFYIDALGLLLTNGSRWGVWLIEFASLCVASIFGFFFLKRFFKAGPAVLAMVGSLINLVFMLEGGNLTEEYALPLQFAALYLLSVSDNDKSFGWRGYLFGITLACAVLLKQTLVGIWIAIFIYLIISKIGSKSWIGSVDLLSIFLGAGSIILVCTTYFFVNNSLGDFWDIAFRYNFLYSRITLTKRLHAIIEALSYINTASGYFIIALVSWIVSIFYIVFHSEKVSEIITNRLFGLPIFAVAVFLFGFNISVIFGGLLMFVGLLYISGVISHKVLPWIKKHQSQRHSSILLPLYIALLDIPIELLLITASGRNYRHYLISLIPPLTILIAFFLHSIVTLAEPKVKKFMTVIWCVILMLPILYNGTILLITQMNPGQNLIVTQTVSYIKSETSDDYVLVWGSWTVVNYLAGRASPTRYVHQTPLFTSGYTNEDRVRELQNDLEIKKPVLIIDTRSPSTPFISITVQGKCKYPDEKLPVGMEQVFEYICSNYKLIDIIGKDEWHIYRYRHETL